MENKLYRRMDSYYSGTPLAKITIKGMREDELEQVIRKIVEDYPYYDVDGTHTVTEKLQVRYTTREETTDIHNKEKDGWSFWDECK